VSGSPVGHARVVRTVTRVFDGMSDFGVRPCVDDARGGVLANGRCGRGRCWFVQDNVRQKKTSDSWKSPSLCPPETYLTPLYAARSSIAVPPFFGMWMNNGPLYWSLYGTVDGPRPR
jgi:hypothetical protein